MKTGEETERSVLTQEAAAWHAHLRSETLTEADEARFDAWLAGDPARRREFEQLAALWEKLEGIAQSPEVLRVLASADAGTRRVSRRAVAGWALAAGVAGVAGFMSWQRLFAYDTYATAVGELKTIRLADGSSITLNTASEVKVRLSGGERRVELLAGQASFEVAPDARRSFVVSVRGAQVLALGTLFDVYRRERDTVVTLIEGRVSVAPGGAPILLSPGEQLTFGAPGRAPVRSTADLQRVSAWRAGKLDFVETPLRDAIAEANRYSRLKIELRAPDLADAPISGIFATGHNDIFAEGLRAYFGVRVHRTADDLIVLTHD
ncbi:MAG TPA: FecR domain-containing protein [Steroidobacteraceae bacterium]|nr:FecR domain-containing protein [Steroidobacteraceae bacterium]